MSDDPDDPPEWIGGNKHKKPKGGIDLTGPAMKGVAGTITKLVLWPDAEQVSAAEFAENLGLPEGTEAWVEKHSTEYPPDAIMVESSAVFEKSNLKFWRDWQQSEEGKMAAVLVSDLGPATLHQTLVMEDGTEQVTEMPMKERPWLQDLYEQADPLIFAKSPTKQRAEDRRWGQGLVGSLTPIEPRDICVCPHSADQHKWLNDPAPLRSRHLRCTMCDCGHFKERDAS